MYAIKRIKYLLKGRTQWTNTNPTVTNGHTYVDLGLSVLWASMNLGATNITQCGTLYQWGSITPFKDDIDKCAHMKTETYIPQYRWWEGPATIIWFTKYVLETVREGVPVDNISTLEPIDDAARQIMKGGWRIPTCDEWFELIQECKWNVVSFSNHTTAFEVKGPSGKKIYLPLSNSSMARYWTSTLCRNLENECAWALYLSYCKCDIEKKLESQKRYEGEFIRGVLDR